MDLQSTWAELMWAVLGCICRSAGGYQAVWSTLSVVECRRGVAGHYGLCRCIRGVKWSTDEIKHRWRYCWASIESIYARANRIPAALRRSDCTKNARANFWKNEWVLCRKGTEDFVFVSCFLRGIHEWLCVMTGLTASAGIANNPMLAKLATDVNKPNGQVNYCPSFMSEALAYVGL